MRLLSASALCALALGAQGRSLRAQPAQELAAGKTNATTVRLHEEAVKANLQLADRWMAFAKNGSATPAAGKAATLVAAPWVPSKDVPTYYDCSLVLNNAWREHYQKPCSANAHIAAQAMYDKVESCGKLKVPGFSGECEYWVSIQSLKEDTDRWCGGPICEPECTKGVRCLRSGIQPYQAFCENNMTSFLKNPEEFKAETHLADENDRQLEITLMPR
eukprot:TRINITY_DN113121_c0_g1_i1.p1 TRINITY_DN113121_c0_g1~~TRINITY_DN113121_c0_g1_i1.p1  ORF type:complete len:218 (+),score=56.99 TRINITY_DN113121_c0_g1_i1:69-722(+)